MSRDGAEFWMDPIRELGTMIPLRTEGVAGQASGSNIRAQMVDVAF